MEDLKSLYYAERAAYDHYVRVMRGDNAGRKTIRISPKQVNEARDNWLAKRAEMFRHYTAADLQRFLQDSAANAKDVKRG